MKTKRLFLSALILLAMSVTACDLGGLPNFFSNSNQGDDTSSTEDGGGDDSSLEPNSGSQNPSSSSNAGGTSSNNDNPPDVSGFTFNDNVLNTPQVIHTTNQRAYLNFSGDYYHITSSQLNGFGMNGDQNLSAPNQVTIGWSYTVPTGKTVSKFSLTYGQKQDLSDGYTINGTTQKSISFYNPYLGDNYFKVTAHFSDGTSESSITKTFKVDAQAPRNISHVWHIASIDISWGLGIYFKCFSDR